MKPESIGTSLSKFSVYSFPKQITNIFSIEFSWDENPMKNPKIRILHFLFMNQVGFVHNYIS